MDHATNTMKVQASVGDRSEEKREINLIFTGELLGEGKCGDVLSAELAETGEMVAVKAMKIRRAGDRISEVEHLKTLKHCNIVNMLYYFRTCNESTATNYRCIVMERIELSLWDTYEIPDKIPEFDLKLIMYQLLRSVAYIHTQGICHRDIKPENILINPDTYALKLCDFDMAIDLSLSDENSPHCGSRSYLAPEKLLGFTNYTNSVDVWSVGCVFVELWKGQTELFTYGATIADQLDKMIAVLGTPRPDQFEGMTPPYPFDDLAIRERKPWEEIVHPYPISDDAISLCSGMLCYSPSSRILPHHALAHKYFDELRSPERRFLRNGTPLPPLFNFQPGEFPGGFNHLIPAHVNAMEVLETKVSRLHFGILRKHSVNKDSRRQRVTRRPNGDH